MAESWETRLLRWRFNRIPAWRGTGARITYIAGDFREIRVRLPLSRRTRNYVGTIFGGSMYAAADPAYMLMLIHILGPEYVVWDKAARIRFRRPGRSTLYLRFVIPEVEIETIRGLLEEVPKVDRVYTVELVDAEGVVHAEVEKTIHVSRRRSGGAAGSPMTPPADR